MSCVRYQYGNDEQDRNWAQYVDRIWDVLLLMGFSVAAFGALPALIYVLSALASGRIPCH